MYADASTLYQTTLDRNPACWMAHNNLANLLVEKGQTREAIRHYDEALRLRPRYLEARFSLGNALLQVGDIEGAIAQCNAALAIKPDTAAAHNNLANALAKQKNFTQAIAHYEQAIALAPRNASMKNNLASLLATCPDASLRDTARAVKVAGEANELSKRKNALFLYTLSLAYLRNGELPEAYKTALRARVLALPHGNQRLLSLLDNEITYLQSKAAGQLPDLPP
jgi:Flp pilus assembly protein TadD